MATETTSADILWEKYPEGCAASVRENGRVIVSPDMLKEGLRMSETSVDLKTLKAGETVHFRCGGCAVVKKIEACKTDKAKRVWLFFDDLPDSECAFLWDGSAGYLGSKNIFDIVRVENGN